MKNRIRFAPPNPNGEILAEISQRTLLGIYLLRPSERLNQIIVGVLAKAQEKYPVGIVAVSFMSNHYHLLITCKTHKELSSFMNFFSSNLAREAGRLHGWPGRLWARRFACIPITDEEKAQVGRLKYILEQGCKEGLVSSPKHWPGLNGIREMLSGEPLKGIWVNRTAYYNARRKKNGNPVRRIDFDEAVALQLVPLPCWAHLSPQQYQSNIRYLVENIEEETQSMHATEGSQVLGRRSVLRKDPLHRPGSIQSSPQPYVHAASRASREAFLAAYRFFSRAYRVAAEGFREGDLSVNFPEGSFPPALPFVEASK
ncbi:MAG: transposase [Deltaproteobacteria bacterium]|nr:transposase [Deltaproteobacteria bacterium]